MPKSKEKYVVDESGKKTAVMLDITAYRQLLERIEDLEDALELDQAKSSTTSFRPYEDVRADLKKSERL